MSNSTQNVTIGHYFYWRNNFKHWQSGGKTFSKLFLTGNYSKKDQLTRGRSSRNKLSSDGKGQGVEGGEEMRFSRFLKKWKCRVYGNLISKEVTTIHTYTLLYTLNLQILLWLLDSWHWSYWTYIRNLVCITQIPYVIPPFRAVSQLFKAWFLLSYLSNHSSASSQKSFFYWGKSSDCTCASKCIVYVYVLVYWMYKWMYKWMYVYVIDASECTCM